MHVLTALGLSQIQVHIYSDVSFLNYYAFNQSVDRRTMYRCWCS